MAYEKLFEPGRIGTMTVKNRAVMSPMATDLANTDGTASPEIIKYYQARAKGGVGLIIQEYTGVDDVDSIPTLHNIGSDPYWLGHPMEKIGSPYEYVYSRTLQTVGAADYYKRDHNIWIQTYSTPRGREEEIVEAAAAAYDAGARTIIAWGYYGSESNDYAAKNPEKTWVTTCEAFRRVREMERDRILAERRAKVNLEG